MAVFQEPHTSGELHFHIATAFSEPFRWRPWKVALQAAGFTVHFQHMTMQEPFAPQAHAVCIHAAILVSAHLPEAFDLARQVSVAAVLQQSAAPQNFLEKLTVGPETSKPGLANPLNFQGFD